MLRKEDFMGSCMDVVVYLCQRDPVLAENLMQKCKLQDKDLDCVKKNMRTNRPPQKLALGDYHQFIGSVYDIVRNSKNKHIRTRFQQILEKI